MGCNFYLKTASCNTCGNKPQGLHLGKSSYGWAFHFQYNGGQFYKNVEEMKEWLKDKEIENEYGESVTHEEFWKMVYEKQKDLEHSMKEGIKKYGEQYGFIIDGYIFSDHEFC